MAEFVVPLRNQRQSDQARHAKYKGPQNLRGRASTEKLANRKKEEQVLPSERAHKS